MNRQFTETERRLTKKNLESQKNKLNELNEQLEINKLKQNFIIQQRTYQDTVDKIESKQEKGMFNKSIRMLKTQFEKTKDTELSEQIKYNQENQNRLDLNRQFTEKWTPYLRKRTDSQNEEINKELEVDIKIIKEIIEVAEDQLKNGVKVKIPTGVD